MTGRHLWSAAEAVADPAATRDALIRRAVRYGHGHSREIRERLSRTGIEVDEIGGAADLAEVPILSKDDLPDLQAADPPFGGMLAVPVARLRRIYESPGPILDPEGPEEDFWGMAPALWAAGFRSGHIVLDTLSYHLTPGGHMMDSGLRAIGCVVIPGGVGNSAAQIRLAARVGAAGYAGTPQFLLTLVEKAAELGLAGPLTRALVTGGPLPSSLRAALEEEHSVDVYEAYGTADAGLLGYECEAKEGWHVAPGVAVELVDPGSGRASGAGETGEVVVTSPNPVYPLLRFGTGDLSASVPGTCPCGRTTPRLAGFLGRVGEGVKVRGMFVHARQIAEVLGPDPAVERFQAIVSREAHRDVLTVRVEAARPHSPDADRLAGRLREVTKLRLSVDIVERGTIEDDAPPLVDARNR